MAGGTGDDRAMDYQTQVIVTILHMIGNLRHAGMAALSEVELSYPQVLVLYALLETGTTTISGVSQHLKLSQGVISRTVDRLVEKGLVERVRDNTDRRVVWVSLSEEGRGYANKTISYHAERLMDQFNEIPKKDRDLFLDLLKRIDQMLEEQANEG